MGNYYRARLASLICLAGSTIQIVYGLLAIPFPFAQGAYWWGEILWALANVGMIAGIVGLVSLDVGRPRALAALGAALAIPGQLLRIAVSALLVLNPSGGYVELVLVSIMLMLLGVSMLGIAVLIGKQLSGWEAWAPLLVVGSGLIISSTYPIDRFIHFILLGVWGVPWMLIGYVVFTHVVKTGSGYAGASASSDLKAVNR